MLTSGVAWNDVLGNCLLTEIHLLSCMRLHVDKLAAFFACAEHYHSVYQCEECMVFAHTYIETGVMLCATLTLQNVACTAA